MAMGKLLSNDEVSKQVEEEWEDCPLEVIKSVIMPFLPQAEERGKAIALLNQEFGKDWKGLTLESKQELMAVLAACIACAETEADDDDLAQLKERLLDSTLKFFHFEQSQRPYIALKYNKAFRDTCSEVASKLLLPVDL